MRYSHIAASFYPHLAIDTHILIGRTWIPVGKTYVGLARLCTEYLYFQYIVRRNMLGNIVLKLAEGTKHRCAIGYLLIVEPNIGAIADAIELEQCVLTFFQSRHLECGAIRPTLVKLLFVDFCIVFGSKCLGLDAVSC